MKKFITDCRQKGTQIMRKKSLLLNAMLISAILAGSCGSKTITRTTNEPTTITSEPSTSSNSSKPAEPTPSEVKEVKMHLFQKAWLHLLIICF